MTNKVGKLQGLLQGLEQQATKQEAGAKQASVLRLQGAITKAQPGTAYTGGQAQATGAALGAQAGEQALAQQGKRQQAATQIGKLGLGEKQLKDTRALREQALAQDKTLQEQYERFAELARGREEELFDRQMKIQKDARGNYLLNERQLADWAMSNARSSEEAREKVQQLKLMQDRKLKFLEVAQQKITQALKTGYLKGKQRLDQSSKRQLILMKKQMEEDFRKERAKAQSRGQMYGAVLGAAGAVVGAWVGNAPGAAAGYAAGSNLGQAAGERQG